MASPTAPTILYKQPSETRTYTMDFTNLLGTAIISSVTSVTSELRGGGISTLVLGSSSIVGSDKKVQFTVAGGVHKNTYRIEVIITTSDSQILEGDGLLTVTNI